MSWMRGTDRVSIRRLVGELRIGVRRVPNRGLSNPTAIRPPRDIPTHRLQALVRRSGVRGGMACPDVVPESLSLSERYKRHRLAPGSASMARTFVAMAGHACQRPLRGTRRSCDDHPRSSCRQDPRCHRVAIA